MTQEAVTEQALVLIETWVTEGRRALRQLYSLDQTSQKQDDRLALSVYENIYYSVPSNDFVIRMTDEQRLDYSFAI